MSGLYLNGGGLGRGAMEPWLGNCGLDRPRFPKMGECCPAIERKGWLVCGGGRDSDTDDFMSAKRIFL